MQEFDLIVIGGGPAGYTGAIRASQLGMKVACVEKRKTLGGTCLNVGCIPSKALLHFSEKYEEANLHFNDIGINLSNLKLDLKKMMQKKDKTVEDLCKGISGLFAKNKIKHFIGHASITSDRIVEIKTEKGSEKIGANNIMIATGSEVTSLPGIDIDEKNIVSSTGALDFDKVPEKMVVIGGGVIGLELGSVWRRLGAEVTVVEYLDKICPFLDNEVSKNFMKILDKQGMKFKLSSKVKSVKSSNKGLEVVMEPSAGGEEEKIHADKVLVSVGRKPNTEGLGLDQCGVKLDQRGFITVDKKYQTNVPGVFAVGDVVGGAMLAHKAEEESVAAVEMMANKVGHVNYNTIPNVIYTHPEIATVGASEEELKNAGREYKVGKFPYLANSRARAIDATDGFVKILADSKTDQILGAHIIAKDAGTMIAELVVAMEFYASSEDIARTCHAHPTLNEAIKEASLAIEKRTINI